MILFEKLIDTRFDRLKRINKIQNKDDAIKGDEKKLSHDRHRNISRLGLYRLLNFPPVVYRSLYSSWLAQKQIAASRTRVTRGSQEKPKNGICARQSRANPSSLCPLVESSSSSPAAAAIAAAGRRRRLPQQHAAESAATSHGVNALTSSPGSAKMHTRATNLPPA